MRNKTHGYKVFYYGICFLDFKLHSARLPCWMSCLLVLPTGASSRLKREVSSAPICSTPCDFMLSLRLAAFTGAKRHKLQACYHHGPILPDEQRGYSSVDSNISGTVEKLVPLMFSNTACVGYKYIL